MPGRIGFVFVAAAALVTAGGASAQTIQPPFDQTYTFVDLGTPAGVPSPLGGLTLRSVDANTLLIGGSANQAGGAIYSVPLNRTCNRISSFAGEAAFFASAPEIDGGLTEHPSGVLFFTRYPINQLGQILPGETMMARSDSLSTLGAAASVGAATFVPPGLPGAGQLKTAAYNAGSWHTISYEPAGDGTFNLTSASSATQISGGPEGIVYVPAGSPFFPNDSVLISEYANAMIGAYEIDANGDPIPGTRRTFMTGLPGAEGAHRDSATGDFMFSTFGGGSRVLVVRGFAADCPGDANGDSQVGFSDLNAVLTDFGSSGDALSGDLNADCAVDFGDLNLVLARFGATCGESAR